MENGKWKIAALFSVFHFPLFIFQRLLLQPASRESRRVSDKPERIPGSRISNRFDRVSIQPSIYTSDNARFLKVRD
jgi:hypothetical protein